ncbi:sugar phosphate isomerase/epimerase [Algoriphagus ratkowskyi]|uniref:Sugar phosphate isomerase/epimerase n=1 Tax=Algoriphagus ratkowskyi TaxID=57028 RepID=A0A2W7RH21_9BACT|nr:sugar phosphate isomerase/epimerase [Algoriphagus ratkowskyi]PZX57660.1 sugar phosphate isomerase/epimerase [Algoriphagus ratkowskyi]TXD78931.1 sugar phosphate isomerase/epimerase [Algoriphagus ratkowskyi]
MKNTIKIALLSLLILSPLVKLQAQEVALQLYSLRNEMKVDPVKYHQLISEWGIFALEGGGQYGLPEAEYENLLQDNELRVVGVGADYNQLNTDIRPIIDQAKKFGAKYAICYWIPHTGGPISIEEIKIATALFNAVGAEMKKEGITFLYHPHGYEFTKYGKKGVVMDYMFKNAKNFAFNMDVYWVKMGGGDPLAIMKKYPGKFPMLHLKDRKKGTLGSKNGQGDVETNVVLGTGDIDIAGLIKEAKKQGTEYLTIEDESSRSVTQIPLSIAYIKKELEKN